MSLTRLILIPALGNEPAPYLVVDAGGTVHERGHLLPDAAGIPPPLRTIAVVPGTDVMARWLDLPSGGSAQVRAAALWALRDSLAAPADRLSVTLGAPGPAGEPRLVLVVNQALLSAWTDYLDALGVRADVLVPDMMTLPVPAAGDALSMVAFGPSLALRGHRFAVAVQPDLLDLVRGDRRVEPIETEAALERALVAAALNPPVNLLAGFDRDGDRGAGGWRRAALLAAVLLISPLVLTLASAARDDLAARGIEAGTRDLIRTRLPDLAASADPVAEINRRLEVAAPPGGLTAAAAALFTAVEGVEGAELDSFVADPETGVRATVSYPSYQDLDSLRAAMAAAGMRLDDTSTVDDGGRVVSEILIGAPA
jgi:general secretion pathway protein L